MPTNRYKLAYGGWYQRTTIHLTEIYDFLSRGYSSLNLDPEKLKQLLKELGLKEVGRQADYLEYVEAKTTKGITVRYYEDGLYLLETTTNDLRNLRKKRAELQNYFEEKFNPAISYIFSLGAPTPKVLANIKTDHPVVVHLGSGTVEDFKINRREFGDVYSQITGDKITVYKTPSYIFIVSQPGLTINLEALTEMQIFFREFKDQLEKYLNIHRTIWEEISQIKERRYLKGSDVENTRSTLESYQKTVSLINSRINQMGSYITTRRSIANNLKVEEELVTLFQYKFEILTDTHTYIKEIWNMTKEYLTSAINVVVEIKNQTTNASVQSLRTITTVGTIALITTWLSRDKFPYLTGAGLFYFLVLLGLTWLINRLVFKAYQNKKYKLTFGERKSDI